MKNKISLSLALFLYSGSLSALTLIGNIPGEYLGQNKNQVFLGMVKMEQRLIKEIKKISEGDIAGIKDSDGVIKLKTSTDYDVIYPGLINLHNHTKQNNLGVWKDAKGQFGSRYEWRQWSAYEDAVSGNMNPWIGFSSAYECAAFRWSELQALILGTTYLQGPSSCVDDFGIHRVEDVGAFITKKAAVQAPTDLLAPNEMDFVWQYLKPDIDKPGGSYGAALAKKINEYCPGMGVTAESVMTTDLKRLKDKNTLVAQCTKTNIPSDFIRYVYFIHPPLAGKIQFLKDRTKRSAVIAHLAEGSRTNEFNRKEFEILKLFGFLDEEEVPLNFVHGVGIPVAEFKLMAQKKMGLIWSPFSNLILYGETLDIKAANEAGVVIALGSDWVPTGTKSVLEEVKIARAYLEKIKKKGDTTIDTLTNPIPNASGKREKMSVDEFLFKSMTEFPARLIRHWEIEPGKEAGVGRIAPEAMASVIAIAKNDADPFVNIVTKATEKDVNLVVLDGKPIYGEPQYLDQAGFSGKYEVLPQDSSDLSISPKKFNSVPASGEDLTQFTYKIADFVAKDFKYNPDLNCGGIRKGFVTPSSLDQKAELVELKNHGVDLDKVADLGKFLSVGLLTQSRNLVGPDKKPASVVTEFPSLYSCNDQKHLQRITHFINEEWDENLKIRDTLIKQHKMDKVSKKLAESYK